MRGIDVSNVNGSIDWPRVKAAGVRFAFVKATEGLTFNDSDFIRNRHEAEAAGIRLGFYHFGRPDLHPGANGAIAEAQHFVHVFAHALGSELRPVLDFEHPAGGDLTAWAATFLAEVERLTGVRPIFYSYSAFIRSNMRGASGLGKYPLWLADYSRNDGTEHPYSTPSAWKSVAIHQFASVGRIPGIRGNVDLDELHALSFDAILCHPAPKPKPKPKPLYPKDRRFWRWLQWDLGEGAFSKAGPRNQAKKPKNLPQKTPSSWWTAAANFLARRK